MKKLLQGQITTAMGDKIDAAFLIEDNGTITVICRPTSSRGDDYPLCTGDTDIESAAAHAKAVMDEIQLTAAPV